MDVFTNLQSTALHLVPPSTDTESYLFSTHPVLAPYGTLMRIPPSAVTPTATTNYSTSMAWVPDYSAPDRLFSRDIGVHPGFNYNPVIPEGTTNLYLTCPILLRDVLNSNDAVIRPAIYAGRPCYPIATSTVGGTGMTWALQFGLSRPMVDGESITVYIVQGNTALTSTHTISTATLGSGDAKLSIGGSDTNVGPWSILYVHLSSTLLSPIEITNFDNNIVKFTLSGNGTNYKTLTYTTDTMALGPSEEKVEELFGITQNTQHAVMGCVQWIVTEPTLGDTSSEISMGVCAPIEAKRLFMSTSDILDQCTPLHRGMYQGIRGAIGIASPLNATLYGEPGKRSLRSIFSQLDLTSSAPSVTVRVQTGIVVACPISNSWMPKIDIPYSPVPVEAICVLASQVASVYENKTHLQAIKKGLKKAFDIAKSEPVRSAAATAWKLAGPLLTSAFAAL